MAHKVSCSHIQPQKPYTATYSYTQQQCSSLQPLIKLQIQKQLYKGDTGTYSQNVVKDIEEATRDSQSLKVAAGSHSHHNMPG